MNKRSTCGSPTKILIVRSLNRVSGLNPKLSINSDIQVNSNIASAKKLNELARKEKPTSPLHSLVIIVNNIKSSKIV